jgi:Holliday junction resolvase RusA-like endonuclease
VIQSQLPTLNDYIQKERGNWAAAASIKKKGTMAVQLEVMSQNRKPIEGIVDVDLYWIVPDNRQDPDNVFFATKYILDGMVKAGVLKEDGRKNIRHISHKIKTIKGSRFVIVKFNPIKSCQ